MKDDESLVDFCVEQCTYHQLVAVFPSLTHRTLERVRELLHIDGADTAHAETVTLDPPAAAARIIANSPET